ncbi:MAG: hypothetical protein KF764_00110 [Labilithrix sp.]|nr:hypothetical protein [Labilithrix sp.]
MRGSVTLVALALVLLARTVAGCGEDFADCYAGDFVACSCADGGAGYAACSARGDYASSACVCDGTPGVDAAARGSAVDAAPTRDAASDASACAADAEAGSKKLFEPCTTSDECEDCACEAFGARGQLCTRSCTSLDDCPAPSSACTNRGVCRPPQ